MEIESDVKIVKRFLLSTNLKNEMKMENYYKILKKSITPTLEEMQKCFDDFDKINRTIDLKKYKQYEIELWKLRHIIDIQKCNLELLKRVLEIIKYYDCTQEEHEDREEEIELKFELIDKIIATWESSKHYIVFWIDKI